MRGVKLNSVCIFSYLTNQLTKHLTDLNNFTRQLLLYLYRGRNKITQLSIPTHAQLYVS